MSDKESSPARQISSDQLPHDTDHENEIAAKQLAKALGWREAVAFAIGFAFFASLEFVRFHYFEHAIDVWTLRGWFIPVSSLMSLLALISSVSMRSSLKDRGYSDAMTNRRKCCRELLTSKDEEGLRLLKGIAITGTIGAFGLGTVAAFSICNTVLI